MKNKLYTRAVAFAIAMIMVLGMAPSNVNAAGSAQVVKWNVTLTDNLRPNFYLNIPSRVIENTVVTVCVGNDDTVSYNASQLEKNAGYYVVSANIAAAQMTDEIALAITTNGVQVFKKTYTIADYAHTILQDANMGRYHDTVSHMLNYGAKAQTYFAYNSEKLADAGYELAAQPTVPTDTEQVVVQGNVAGISFYGATLLFQEKIAIRYYFSAPNGVSGYTFKVGDKTLAPAIKDGLYYVQVNSISPQNYGEEVTVTVQGGAENLYVTYSPMHYITRMCNQEKSSESLKALLRAVYGYHLAACDLADALVTPEDLGYTKITMNDLGIADGTYNDNAVRTTAVSGGLGGKYLDVDVSFGDNFDPSSGIKIANTASTSWDGFKVGLLDQDRLTVNYTATNREIFTITKEEAGIRSFQETFNLKIAMIIEDSVAAGCKDVTFTMWINDVIVRKNVKDQGLRAVGDYAGILTWNGASVTVGTPVEEQPPEEEPENPTPEYLGYSKITMNDLGIADGMYSGNSVTTTETAGGLDGKYLDVDVAFGGAVDASSGIKIANTAPTSWDGFRIGLTEDDYLTVNYTSNNVEILTLTPEQANVACFTETFNLKVAIRIEDSAAQGCKDVTFTMWINDKLIIQDLAVVGLPAVGDYAGILTWNNACITVATPEITPEELGYSRITMVDLNIANGTYSDRAVRTAEVSGGLNGKYLDVDVSFGGAVDASSGIKIANTAPTSWDGFKIGVLEGDRLTVNYTSNNLEIFTLTPQEANVMSFTETFNLKVATKVEDSIASGCKDVTFTMWINDCLIKRDVLVQGLQAIGNYAGILTWNGASVTVETPSVQNGNTGPAIPDYNNPPAQMGGKTWAGNYITSVNKQSNTTVISAADTDNGYATATDYRAYGLDYVLDLNVDREVRILQITDTQIIDAAQCRTENRLSDSQKIVWGKETMYNNLFRYIFKAVNDTKPDLILVTGDIIYGEFDDDGTSLRALINCMDSLGIPWAPIYGNHENESKKGVLWQSKQLEESPYCLFTRRNEIGGNGNYSIGIAKNGSLERVVYMMDSNGCSGSAAVNGTTVKKTVGFTEAQKQWYRNLGLQINQLSGKTIPSFLCYHIATDEVLYAAQAAGYQTGADSKDITYTIGVDNVAQPGDSGYKGELFLSVPDPDLLPIMQEVGSDGAFFGHAHLNSTSVLYEGIRWTFGLKTGTYDQSPAIVGGTLITLHPDSNAFTVEQTQTTPQTIGLEYPAKSYTPPLVVAGGVTPEELGYTVITLADLGIADGVYNTNAVTTVEYEDGLNNICLNVDVAFAYKADGTVDASTGIKFANKSVKSWDGIRIGLANDDKLTVNYTSSNLEIFTLTASEAGVESFTQPFNLKFAAKIEDSIAQGCQDVTITMWINNELVLAEYYVGGLPQIGNCIGLLTWNGAGITVETPTVISSMETEEVYALSFDVIGGEDVMPVAGFYGPYVSSYTYEGETQPAMIQDQYYKMIQDGGVNLIVYSNVDYEVDPVTVSYMLQLGQRYGIGHFITDSQVKSGTLSTEELASRIREYSGYSSFCGVHVVDEPFLEGIVGDGSNDMRHFAPIFAQLEEIGVKAASNILPNWVFASDEKFETYVNTFVEECAAPYLSVDYYVFDKRSNKLTDYFYNLSIFSQKAEEAQIPLWVFVQAGSQWNDSFSAFDSVTPYYPDEGQFDWNVNTALAYGAKGIQYFPLVQPYWYAWTKTQGLDCERNGIIGAWGNKTQWYYYAQNLSTQITAIDEVLMHSVNKGVIVSGAQAQADSVRSERIIAGTSWRELANVTGDALIGCFNYEGKTALYVVNYDMENSQNVKLDFQDQYSFFVVQDGEKMRCSGSGVTLPMAAGEGVLIVFE